VVSSRLTTGNFPHGTDTFGLIKACETRGDGTPVVRDLRAALRDVLRGPNLVRER